MSKTIRFSDLLNPSPRQKDFLEASDRCRFVLYGGAAGGGKSHILRWGLVRRLIKLHKQTSQRGIRVGLFCEDYPTLSDRHLSKLKYEFPEWMGTYKEVSHEFTLAPGMGGGVICFRNLDKLSKYLSSEFAAVAVDELTQNPRDVFDILRMRLRWPGIPTERTSFWGATNPGGVGHGWVKGLWVDRQFPAELDSVADQFAFIQAKSSDNPYLDSSYTTSLQSLPDHLRRAYADGDWDVFAGQVFTEFRRADHVCEPFKIPETWIRFRSFDWGYAKPFSCHWWAVDHDGVMWCYREYYGCRDGEPDTGIQMTAAEVGKEIKRLEADDKISYGVADPAISQKQSGPSIEEEMAGAGVYWTHAINDRLQGKMQLHHRLKDGKIKWFSTCVHAIRTIPALVYDKVRVEDVDTNQEDHAYDDTKYALMSRPYHPARAKKEKPKDYTDMIEGGKETWMSL